MKLIDQLEADKEQNPQKLEFTGVQEILWSALRAAASVIHRKG